MAQLASEMSMRPRTRTASTSTVETARGTHVFKVDRYSQHKGRGVGNFVRSATFGVGGYDWSIRFYPDGSASSDYVSVFLELRSTNVAEVMVIFDLRLVDQATGQSTVLVNQASPKAFTSDVTKNPSAVPAFGTTKFKKRSELEASSSTFLRDDCLVIECDVTIPMGKPWVKQKTAAAAISAAGFEVAVARVPPSDLSDSLRRLLEEKQGADVTFKVQDEVFPAHKIILAMRSPVFSAEFFGPVAVAAAETSTSQQCVITIEDMHPDVFGALLHFVYTDTMPASMDELDAGERKEMVRHLLVAADMYAMEKLKLMCEASLCKSIAAEDVADMAALADRYRCEALRHACAQFIASSNENEIGDVVASQGYVNLKKTCPAVLVTRHVRESYFVALSVMKRCSNNGDLLYLLLQAF